MKNKKWFLNGGRESGKTIRALCEVYSNRIAKLEQQIEKMKCCSNCKHFNKVEDNEYCWNCERHLVNSLDNLKAEEIIKDEWEIEK